MAMTYLQKRERFDRLMRRWAAVEKCMETMDDKSRQALRMEYLEGAGDAQIAKELGVSKNRAYHFKAGAHTIMTNMLYGHSDEE